MSSQLLLSIRALLLAWLIGYCNTERIEHGRNRLGTTSPYSLVEHYEPKHFFDKFVFYTEGDPTYGFVQYVNHSYAKQNGLIKTYRDRVTIGVDNVNVYDPRGPGRPSVRIQSHKTYTHGLFILDLNQMPHACGAWPAFWTFGPSWPSNGEIDIIEGVNTNNYNLVSLHTDNKCSVAGANQWGELVTANCAQGNSEQGCGVLGRGKYNETFGHGFNKHKGGVYAMEWTSSYIRTWHFRRHNIPLSIRVGTPDPSKFGKPMANFQGSCDMDKHFKDHTIVFDVTFCGQYAGAAYSQSDCPNAAGGYRSCMDFVGNNPDHFNNVQWDINSLMVYQLKGGQTSYLTAAPTQLSSVMPLASTLSSAALSSLQIPGGGHTKHVPSHTLSVATSHKSNKPPRTTSTHHRPSKTHHPSSSSSASKTHHSVTYSTSETSQPTTTGHTKKPTKPTSKSSFSSSGTSTITTSYKPKTSSSETHSEPHMHKPSETDHRSSESNKHKSTFKKSSKTTAKHPHTTSESSHTSETSTKHKFSILSSRTTTQGLSLTGVIPTMTTSTKRHV